MRLKVRVAWPSHPLHESKHLVFISKQGLVADVERHISKVLEIEETLRLRAGEYYLPSQEDAQILNEVDQVDCVVEGEEQNQGKRRRPAKKTVLRAASSSSSDVEISYEAKKPTKKRKVEISRPQKRSQNSNSSSESSESNKSTPVQRHNRIPSGNKVEVEPTIPCQEASHSSSSKIIKQLHTRSVEDYRFCHDPE